MREICPECGGFGGFEWLDEWGSIVDFMICEKCSGSGKVEMKEEGDGNA